MGCLGWLAPTVLAQVPAHATLLNPNTLQWPPTLVQQGDTVHAFALGTLSVAHARSLDGGRTWPLREQPLGALESGATVDSEHHVEVVARPGELLVFGDNRSLGPQLVRSLDGGTTWSPPVPIAAAAVAQAARMNPRAHADGSNLFCAWANPQPNGRVFGNRSTDSGATWQPTDQRLDVGLSTTSFSVHTLRVIGSGPVLNVFWNQGQAYHQRSVDGGVTWLPTPVQLPLTGTLNGATGDGNGLLVINQSNGMLRSADGGATWAPVAGTGITLLLGVAMSGPLAVAVGLGTSAPPTYLVNTSGDGGATWRPLPLALPAPSFSFVPRAFARPGELFVQWRVPGFPGNVIRTVDAGATWHVLAGPVQGGFSPGERRTLHVETTDLPSAFPRHHVYVGVGSSRLGTATTGTGGQAPSLTTSGLPVLGGSTTLQGSGAVGGSLAALALSLAPPTATPLGSATIHLASLDLLLALPTSGASGQAGVGTFSAGLAIPNSQALVGTRLVAQALVVDGGSPDGFAVTNALEIWLR